jgi:serine phosphatase RsbU (regulator of sigma subunit)
LHAVIAVAVPDTDPTLPDFEQGLLRQLAITAGVALDNLLAFTTEHLIALTLQRALLPRALPLVPNLELEARYFAAEEGVSVGGDFYDAFELAGGRTCVVVGDVQGHSLHAATLMAELRFSLRAFLSEDNSAARALNLLDELMRRNHPSEMATLALLVVESDCRRVEVANAGHIPPLLVTASDASFVEQASPVLGIVPKTHGSHWIELTEPTMLVLVTDGLIERRGENLAVSLQRMLEIVQGAATLDPVTVADVLVTRFATGPAQDDIALLLACARPT